MFRKIIKYGTVAAVLGSALGLTFYFLLYQSENRFVQQSQAIPLSQTAPTPTEEIAPSRASFPINVQQWTTYQNEKYGLNFKYPATWNLDIKERSVASAIPGYVSAINFTFETDMKDELGKPRQGGFSLTIYENRNNLTLDGWIRGIYGDKERLLILAKPNVPIGNAQEALRIADDKAYWENREGIFSNLPDYYIRSRSYFFVLSWYVHEYTYDMRVLEPQILPTFGFSK